MLENIINNYPFLQNVFFGNTLLEYLIAVVAFVVLSILFKIIKEILFLKLKKISAKTKTDIDDLIVEVISTVKPPFYLFLSLYLSLRLLTLNEFFVRVIDGILLVWVIYLIIKAAQLVIGYIARKKINQEHDSNTQSALAVIQRVSVIALWTLGAILVLQNLGFNVNSLLAGLGIGGVAIAFALQKILGDLFSSFSIYFDKPFVVGDFIIIGEHMGVVEKIGIKTTRIRALQGEQIIISNSELTSSRIQNFKKMQQRRIVFSFGVIYGTNQEKLIKIPSIVKNIIEEIDITKFDRSHFKEFGQSALIFENVYYLNSNDYNRYMDVQQEINLKLNKIFLEEKIEIAYPTQTIFISK